MLVDLVKMVEALPDQEGKDEILEKLRGLIGDSETPVFTLRISAVPYIAYEVHMQVDESWCWEWHDESEGEEDVLCGFDTYLDTIQDIKRDVRDNLACSRVDLAKYLNILDKEMRL